MSVSRIGIGLVSARPSLYSENDNDVPKWMI